MRMLRMASAPAKIGFLVGLLVGVAMGWATSLDLMCAPFWGCR